MAALDLTDRLDRLKGFWRDAGAPLSNALAPGLDDATITSLTGELGLTLPGEARRWFRWHNGAVPGTRRIDRELTPTFEILSRSESVQQCTAARRDSGDDPYVPWQDSWLPFGLSLSGALICFDCSEPSRDQSPIVVRDWHVNIDVPYAAAESLAETVDIWIDMFEVGAFVFDRAGGFWRLEFERVPPELRITGLV